MRSTSLALLISVTCSVAGAAEPARKSADVGAAIDRGLAYLARDAKAWRAKHNCVSCHHASLVIWSMREAKEHGTLIDEPVLAELTKWVADAGDGRVGLARPAIAPRAANSKAVHLALGLNADADADAVSKKGLESLLKTVKADQIGNGSWSAWPETRPPIFGNSDETLTALATLALLPAAQAGDESAKSARDKAIDWLAKTKSDEDPQSIALRMILWKRLGRPAAECQPLVAHIKGRQNADGGWSQTKEMASDAWATGQALYALAHAGLSASDSPIARAQAFLVKTQKVDGSWPMTSRPTKPGGKGSNDLNPITCAGSAWAIIGLARTR